MCTVFNCLAYNDIDATIRLDERVIFLALDDANTSVHVTLNPLQVRTLAKYLSVALTQIDFANLFDEQHFGDIIVQIEQDENELAAASLIAGIRETFLKKKTDYAVDPASVLYALHGQAVHSINERHTQVDILSEERL